MKVEQVTAYKSDSGRVFEHLEDAATDSLKTLVLNVFSTYSYSFDDDLPVVEEVVQNLMFKREELIKVLSLDVEKKGGSVMGAEWRNYGETSKSWPLVAEFGPWQIIVLECGCYEAFIDGSDFCIRNRDLEELKKEVESNAHPLS